MIDAQSLTRYYGNNKAVDDVSFAIGDRAIVGLLGHNGAGKTTVMKMLSGYLEPTAGQVQIDGMDLETHRREIQRRLGYLPENLPVYPEMTIADYLDYAASLKGLRGTGRATCHTAQHRGHGTRRTTAGPDRQPESRFPSARRCCPGHSR
jgi:ABC-2 type transport system ATP-binding protein